MSRAFRGTLAAVGGVKGANICVASLLGEV
jgi:hypothetical protein